MYIPIYMYIHTCLYTYTCAYIHTCIHTCFQSSSRTYPAPVTLEMSRLMENRQTWKPGLSSDVSWPKLSNPEFFFSLQSYLWLPSGYGPFFFEVVGLELMCAFKFPVLTQTGGALVCSCLCLSGAWSRWLLFLLSACFLDLMSNSLRYNSGSCLFLCGLVRGTKENLWSFYYSWGHIWFDGHWC